MTPLEILAYLLTYFLVIWNTDPLYLRRPARPGAKELLVEGVRP